MNFHSASGRVEPMGPSEARSRLKEIARILELKEKNHSEYLIRHANELEDLKTEQADLEAKVNA